MKKIFMPSTSGLYKMQEEGLNIYSYLIAKVVETLTMDGVVLTHKGILNKDCLFKYITEDPEIVIPICNMYPELIPNFEVAYNDLELCNRLLEPKKESSELDNLKYFSKGSGILTNQELIKKVIILLSKELKKNPKYRFTYQENPLLDNIFSTEVLKHLITNLNDKEKQSLLVIEPYYGIILNAPKEETRFGLVNYLDRYHINPSNGDNYRNQDILTNPDNRIKRLIKTINKNI